MAREISGVDRVLRSFGGMGQIVRNANGARNLALGMARTAGGAGFAENRAAYNSDLAKRIVPESMRPGFRLAELSRNLAGMNYHARMQSDALRYGKMFGNLGLSS